MPSGPRIRGNNSFGVTTDNPLTAGATSFNSPGLATLPVVSSAHAVVVLDPKRVFGAPEIVVVTSHTAAATVATITRGQYGTTARSHPQGTAWAHVPVDEDYIEILTSATRPSNPYEGQFIYETDTDVLRGYNGTAWSTTYLDPPSCQATRASVSLTNGSDVVVSFTDADIFDTDNMHSTAVNPTRITFNTAGLYLVTFVGTINAAGHIPELARVVVRANSTTTIAAGTHDHERGDSNLPVGASGLYKATAGQFVDVVITQTNSGGVAKDLLSSLFSACWLGKG